METLSPFMKYVAQEYNDFQTSFEEMDKEEKYLNYGYTFTKGESFEQKQKQLCLEVFKAASIQPNDMIVDVGFGSGEQDFLLARKYEFKKLIGFNIADKQVKYATALAQQKNLADKLLFHHGEAENMQGVNDNSIDKIVAIECAFYFNRPRFYKEAARVLKPGGLLVLADITVSDTLKFLAQWGEELQRVGYFSKNKTEWEKYFQTISVKQINKYIRPGAQMAVFQILKKILKIHSPTKKIWIKMAFDTQIVVLGLLTSLIRYDLIVVEKI